MIQKRRDRQELQEKCLRRQEGVSSNGRAQWEWPSGGQKTIHSNTGEDAGGEKTSVFSVK